ncbi:Bud site selection protein 6 [Gryganskiella cystojenkinii]|nr:Bud site selection protein 6 [Gryganskiella cystojenkinii]
MEYTDHSNVHHSSSQSGTSSRRRKTDASNPIEATVTKLLVATKQLLESLTLWSQKKMTEEQVSDIFVQLATQFNLACQSFHDVGIETRELAHIPDDLRGCLETALGEEPSPHSLDQYLPKIKEIIINLLQGLRLKQNIFREQNETKHARVPHAGTSSSSSRSKSSGSNYRQPSIVPSSVQSPDVDSSRGTPGTSATTVPHRSQSLSTGAPAANAPTFSISSPDDIGHAQTLASLRKSDAITRRASSRRHSQRFSTLLEQNAPPPVPRRQAQYGLDSGMLFMYPGGASGGAGGYTSSQGSTPITSPISMMSYGGQFAPMPTSPSLSSASLRNKSMESLPQPASVQMTNPPPPPQSQTPNILYSGPIGSPQLGTSSMMQHATTLAAPQLELGMTPQPSPMTVGSAETMSSLAPNTTLSQTGTTSSLSIPSSDMTGLRMIFMEKFQYNPGQEDFPTIYVKDPQTNIHYELESLADVKQNAFLSLNVDDLENIQRKMDQGFATLTKELSDIKKAQELAESNRQKAAAAAAAAVANSPPERKIASMEGTGTQALRSVVNKVMAHSKTTSSASLISTAAAAADGKISAAELKPQYEEVLSLRRDLGVVRQLYTELQTDTKTALGSLAGYTSQIRKQALEGPVSSRTFIESGKVKLDQKSEGLTNRIEDLQDVVEDMKLNVTQRRGRPSDHSIAFADKQCEELGNEIEELSDFIQTIRPAWKKTWEVELQTIVKEQMFLKEQEALLEDLKEDRASLLQTLANLKKLLELQVKNGGLLGGRSREFVFSPSSASFDEGDLEGLKSSVLEEVKMIAPDSDRRLRAMAQMEKLRHIELSNRIDEFEEELTTFVGSSKLRKTGGALEVERQRQQRDSEHLKAMFASKIKAAEANAAATAVHEHGGDQAI